MKFTLFACGLVAIMIASTSHAETSSAAPVQAPATITAPAAAATTGYAGPSSLQLMTAQQVQASALDDQHIRLQGRISAHAHGKKYTFTDATGDVQVEISSKRFPVGKTIGPDQRVELIGEVDRGFNSLKVKIKDMRVLP